ncbi:MAG: 50S ribosomal protein L22 [uncultured bacterium]|nr:MAG: 50S ribosomal protein L22 [uncultured bacterium]
MEIVAVAKNVRISPQKARLVVDQIKKMGPQEAIKMLDFIPKGASLVLKKVVASAIANAKNNFGLSEDSTTFKEILVTKGIVFKRYRAVSRGRVHPILKRTSHIKVILEGEQKKEVSKISQVPEVSQESKDQKESDKSKVKN